MITIEEVLKIHILNIETATSICSVALTKNNELLSLRESDDKNSHSSKLTLFIDEVIKEVDINYTDLDAIAVSKGPGSYTGLRIGVSTAKGLCYALDKPLISVGTLQAMALGMAEKFITENLYEKPVLFCPMIDARRMEVYSALYDSNNKEVREIRAEIIDKNSFSEFLQNNEIIFFGDGASKCKQVLAHRKNAIFIDNFFPSASFITEIANLKFKNKDFEDVAYFEPFYLKDFIPGKPKVKGLY